MPQQLELFRTPQKPTEQVVNTERAKAVPPYDPNAFHHIYEIKENGEREWVDSYTSKFSVKYAMEIFYCNLKHKSSFDLNNRKEAQQAIKVSESMRSVTLELNGHLYICTSNPCETVIEGKNGSKFDYKPWRPE
jgi:hypothetical protein